MNDSSTTDGTNFAFKQSKKEVEVAILFVVFVLFGICGNSLVITVLHKKMKHSFKTMVILLTSLAIADLLHSIFVGIPDIAQRFTGTWRAGSVVCKIYTFLRAITGEISVFTLAVIGFERFRTMAKTNSKPIRTVYLYMVLACIWIYLTIVGLPYILVFDIHERSGVTTCAFRPDSEDYTAFVDFVMTFSKIANFSIPLTFVVISYGGVIWRMLKAQGQVQALNSTTSHNTKQKQVAKLCVFVVVAFLVFWTPMRIALVARVLNPQEKAWPVVIGYSRIGTMLGSCLNPILYGLMWKQFRDKTVEMLYPMLKIKCHTHKASGGNERATASSHTNVPVNGGMYKQKATTNTSM